MATVVAEYENREMSIGRIFSRAFGAIGHNPLVVISLAFVAGAVPTLLLTYAAGILMPAVSGLGTSLMVNGWISILASALLQGTMTRVVLADREGRKASLLECVISGIRSLVPLVGLGIAIGFCVGIGAILLIVPGIMLLTAWFVAMPALAEEREGILDALSRSADLTSGARWKIFAIFLIMTVVNGLIGGVVGLILGMNQLHMYSLLDRDQLTLASAGAALFLHTVVAVLWGTMQPSAYVELREWKEGGSTETLEQVFA